MGGGGVGGVHFSKVLMNFAVLHPGILLLLSMENERVGIGEEENE